MYLKLIYFIKDRDKNQVLNNIFSLGVLQIANYIVPLIVLPYLVITLGVEKFGVLSFALAIIHYFNIFIEYGFNLSATREISIANNNIKKISNIFSSVMIIKITLFLLLFIILNILIYFFEKLEDEWLVYYFTFFMLFGRTIFPVWYFQGIEKMKYITLLNIIPKFIATVCIFIFINESGDYIYVPLINSTGVILGGLVGLLIALKSVHLSIPTLEEIKNIFYDSTSLFISNLAITLFTVSNILILGIFTNDYTVGIYSSIERLISAIKNLFVPIYQGIFPWLSQKKIIDIRRIIKKLFVVIFIFAGFLTAIIFNFSESILELIYNKAEITNNAIIMKILSFITLISALNMLFNYLYLNSIKGYKVRMKIFLVTGIFGIILAFVLTYNFKIYGISISFLGTEIILLLFGLYYFKRGEKIL